MTLDKVWKNEKGEMFHDECLSAEDDRDDFELVRDLDEDDECDECGGFFLDVDDDDDEDFEDEDC